MFEAGEHACPVLVEHPCGGRRGRAVGSIVHGLKPDMAIRPKTEDHAERHSERNQAEKEQNHSDQPP